MTYSPEQYQANKDRIKANQKRYYLKTRETCIAKQKEYDTTHKEQIYAKRREKRRVLKEVQTEDEPMTRNN